MKLEKREVTDPHMKEIFVKLFPEVKPHLAKDKKGCMHNYKKRFCSRDTHEDNLHVGNHPRSDQGPVVWEDIEVPDV